MRSEPVRHAVTSPRLRPAQTSDLTALLSVEQECMDADAWGEPALAAELAGGAGPGPRTRHVLLAAGPTGDVVGFAVLLLVEPVAEILRVAVVPAHRRRGVARALLAALLAEADRRGCDEVFLEVDAGNRAANAMYRAAGFTEISRRLRYYAGGVDATVMRKAL